MSKVKRDVDVESEVFTVSDVARYLKVSRGWVYANIDTLPHRRAGSMFRFSKKAIDEWLAQDRDAQVMPEARATAIMDGVR